MSISVGDRTLRTKRLHLIAATSSSLTAELQGRAELARELSLEVPESWPPELYDEPAIRFTLDRLMREPEEVGWWLYYAAELDAGAGAPSTLVGVAGYKGPPSEGGVVEVGYGTLPERRRSGFATEATRGLIDRAFGFPSVSLVIAETYPHMDASIGVMTKCGMKDLGAGSEDGVVRYGISREEWVGRTL